jgi:hypothetical protein
MRTEKNIEICRVMNVIQRTSQGVVTVVCLLDSISRMNLRQ